MMNKFITCLCTFPACPDGSPNGTCLVPTGRQDENGACFTFVEEIYDRQHGMFKLEKRFGCFSDWQHALFQCKGYLVDHHTFKNISCCDSGNFCNKHLLNEYVDGEIVYQTTIWDNLDSLWAKSLILGISVLFLVVFFAILLFCLKPYLYKKRKDILNSHQVKSLKNLNFDSDRFHNCQKSATLRFSSPSSSLTFPSSIDDGINFEEDKLLQTPSPPSSLLSLNNHNNIALGFDVSPSDSSGSGGLSLPASSFQYAYLNGSSSGSSSSTHYSFNYRNLTSSTSNTMSSSLMSEHTQQTMLSMSQKPSMTASNLPTVKEGVSEATSSGSGSGKPRLIQKTLGRDIVLKRFIGEGRFGKVWQGTRHCENYAVKFFFSHENASWKREVEVYSSMVIRDENIATYVGSDVISYNGCTLLLLVLDYYELGSLYDYLNRQPIVSVEQTLSLMNCIISGVSRMHSTIIGIHGKQGMAHRDLKSKSILMKSDRTCCISDFALAVTRISEQKIYIEPNHRSPTTRYMAPEVLNSNMNENHFEEYCYGDIYSVSLIFWEILNRLQIDDNNDANHYQKPYDEFFLSQSNKNFEPTKEELKKIVCDEKLRPSFNLPSLNDELISDLVILITECWTHNASARLVGLRIKKKILDLIQKNEGR